jgi:signal transduction histidine kinase
MLEKQGVHKPIKYLSKMDAQINNLTRLFDELLDGSKIQAGKLDYTEEFFDINALIQGLVEWWRYTGFQ